MVVVFALTTNGEDAGTVKVCSYPGIEAHTLRPPVVGWHLQEWVEDSGRVEIGDGLKRREEAGRSSIGLKKWRTYHAHSSHTAHAHHHRVHHSHPPHPHATHTHTAHSLSISSTTIQPRSTRRPRHVKEE
jgi:hypothetical protein